MHEDFFLCAPCKHYTKILAQNTRKKKFCFFWRKVIIGSTRENNIDSGGDTTYRPHSTTLTLPHSHTRTLTFIFTLTLTLTLSRTHTLTLAHTFSLTLTLTLMFSIVRFEGCGDLKFSQKRRTFGEIWQHHPILLLILILEMSWMGFFVAKKLLFFFVPNW